MLARLSDDERETLRQIAYEDELVSPRLRPETLAEKVATLRPRMVAAAAHRRTMTYSELTNGFTDLSQVDVGDVLQATGLLEDRVNRPLLPAVVVRSKTGRPGDSFFELAESAAQVSEPVPSAADEAVRRWMWAKYLEQVWSYDWESPLDAERKRIPRDALFP